MGNFAIGVILAFQIAFSMVSFGEGDLKGPQYLMESCLFTNLVCGYSVQLGEDFSVDMSMAEVCTILTSPDTRIEIYQQELNGDDINSYTGYSNGFLANSKDHHLIFEGWESIGEHEVYVTCWYRDKLRRVEQDKNYYITFDIGCGQCVYSIFVKTSKVIQDPTEYYSIPESFRIIPATERKDPWTSEITDMSERNWNAETLAYYQSMFGNDSELQWGLFEPLFCSGTIEQVDCYEDVLNYDFQVLLHYSAFRLEPEKINIGPLLDLAWKNGKVLELTLQTYNTLGGNDMYCILQGKYDLFLKKYAQTIANFGHPVLFRLNNEMNGDWCPYSGYLTSKDTLIYKEVYRYVYDVFKECGADRNTIWVWNPNGKSFPNYDWNHSLMYYPGDAYVDVVGMTAYNTGTYYASFGETWQEFEPLYRQLYRDYCATYAHPLMITEFSCANMGGDKNRWVENMFHTIGEYDRIKIAVWWDHCDYDSNGFVSRSYVLDETPELLEIFRMNLAK